MLLREKERTFFCALTLFFRFFFYYEISILARPKKKKGKKTCSTKKETRKKRENLLFFCFSSLCLQPVFFSHRRRARELTMRVFFPALLVFFFFFSVEGQDICTCNPVGSSCLLPPHHQPLLCAGQLVNYTDVQVLGEGTLEIQFSLSDDNDIPLFNRVAFAHSVYLLLKVSLFSSFPSLFPLLF